uniref:G-protein coupled receptors family 1 profile domain-containing protein n=1 Tax=Catharus ustulatus TaxID=91951 RepID=A0A8C3UB44_CATUS
MLMSLISLCIPYSLIAFAGMCLGISLCGLAGNGVVMWFLGFHTKQSPFTVYILNLAVADFSLLLLFLLLILAFLVEAAFCTSLFPFIHHYSYFVFAVGLLCHLFDLSSLGLLAALSTERCLSVLCPIWYRCHRPRHLSGIVSGALWALAGVFVSSLYITYTYTEDSEIVLAGVALTISMVFSLMMLISNLLLFLKLRCGSRRRQPGKLFVAILLNVLLFFAFDNVIFIIVLFTLLLVLCNFLQQLGYIPVPTQVVFLLNCINSSIKPFIYFVAGRCWSPCSMESLRLSLHRVFEEEEENPADSDDANTDTLI